MKIYDIQPGDKVRPGEPVIVDRYTPATRIIHWITAICLIVLTLSGLALFDPSLFFLTKLFGGGENARWLHPWFGVAAFLAFYGLFFRFWRSCLFVRDDLAWMLDIGEVLSGHEENAPEVGRYNPGQKLYFWAMSVMMIILLVSGLALWDQYFYPVTGFMEKRIAVVVHSVLAVLAICGVIVHVYMGLWERGTLRAMTRGWVTGGWAWKHHRKWLRELVSGGH